MAGHDWTRISQFSLFKCMWNRRASVFQRRKKQQEGALLILVSLYLVWRLCSSRGCQGLLLYPYLDPSPVSSRGDALEMGTSLLPLQEQTLLLAFLLALGGGKKKKKNYYTLGLPYTTLERGWRVFLAHLMHTHSCRRRPGPCAADGYSRTSSFIRLNDLLLPGLWGADASDCSSRNSQPWGVVTPCSGMQEFVVLSDSLQASSACCASVSLPVATPHTWGMLWGQDLSL